MQYSCLSWFHDVVGDTRVDDGKWHHVALTYGGSNLRLYVDGGLDGSNPTTGDAAPLTGTGFVIGSEPGGTLPLVGDLDEVAYYTRGISATEVEDHFVAAGLDNRQCSDAGSEYSATVCSSDPLGYWRLNDTNSVVADQLVPGNPGTFVGGVTSGRPSVVREAGASATQLDGSSAQISIPYDEYGTYASSALSMETWVRTTWRNSTQMLVSRNGLSGHSLYINGTKAKGRLMVGGTQWDLLGVSDIAEGRWHHIALTYDESVARLFVDGDEEATQSIGGPLDPFVGVGFEIGSGSGTLKLHGDMDEVAVYDRPLSDFEISERLDQTQEPYGCSSGIESYPLMVCGDVPVGYWKLDDSASSSAAIDQTFVLNPGSYEPTSGGPQLGMGGVSGTSVSLDGGDDEISVPYDEYGHYANDSLSMETWVKTSVTNETQFFVTRGGTSGHALYQGGNTAKARVSIGGQLYDAVGQTIITDGDWHHLAMTFESNTLSLYVDGALDNSNPDAIGVADWLVDTGIDIGHDDGIYRMEGFMDEVAIYARGLTGAEVAEHAIYAP